jgi:hypothetical protein
MSRENVERYLRAHEASNRGDLDAFLREAPDEWHTQGTFPGIEPVYRGREGMIALWEFFHGPWEIQHEIERIEDLGDTLMVLLIASVKGDASGAEATYKTGHVATTDENGFVRLWSYLSWEETLEAVGLRE